MASTKIKIYSSNNQCSQLSVACDVSLTMLRNLVEHDCRGYMAPEYLTRCQLTEKVDVFSYGVLLMEVITGKNTMGRTQSGRYVFLVDEVSSLQKQ